MDNKEPKIFSFEFRTISSPEIPQYNEKDLEELLYNSKDLVNLYFKRLDKLKAILSKYDKNIKDYQEDKFIINYKDSYYDIMNHLSFDRLVEFLEDDLQKDSLKDKLNTYLE